MRSPFKLIDKKILMAIAMIATVISIGVLHTAQEQNLYVLNAQVDTEHTIVTAYVDNASPSQNTIVNVTVTGPAGANVKLVCHYNWGDSSYSAVIESNGKVVIPIRVGSALPGYAVLVDVSVQSDKTYTTQTMFIPH